MTLINWYWVTQITVGVLLANLVTLALVAIWRKQ